MLLLPLLLLQGPDLLLLALLRLLLLAQVPYADVTWCHQRVICADVYPAAAGVLHISSGWTRTHHKRTPCICCIIIKLLRVLPFKV
jgi:hypothetical protein